MKRMLSCSWITIITVVLIIADFSYAQTIITPSGATANSSMSTGRTPDKTYDRSGLSDPGTPDNEIDDTHGIVRGDQWMSDMLSSPPTWLKLTLPSASDIDCVYFWNNIGDGANRGVKSCNFSFSVDGGLSYGNTTNLSFSMAVNPSVSEKVVFPLQTGVTHVKLDSFVTHGDARYVGIAEIRFGVPVPAGLPTLTALSASSITTTEAQLSMELGGADSTVTVYWEAGTVADPSAHTGWDGTNGPSAAVTGTVSRTASNLTADTEYSYAFYATNSVDEMDVWSSVATFNTALSDAQAPSFSSDVAAVASIELAWSVNDTYATGYILQRSTNSSSGPYTFIDVGDTTTYTDRGLLPSTTYYYGLAATNSSNGSITDFSLCVTNATTLPLVGEVIAEYTFTGGYTSSDSNVETTASDLTANGHAALIASGYYEADCADVGTYLTAGDYLSFSINVAVGSASLTAIEWFYGSLNDYQFSSGIFSDAYLGYGATSAVIPGTFEYLPNSLPFSGSENLDVATNRKVVDLNGISEFQNLSGTNVAFRIYIGDGASTAGRKHRFDNIKLYADVTLRGTVFRFR